MKFVLAPEMTPSLASLTVLGLERDSAESAARGSLGKRTPDAKLGQSPEFEYVSPHYFNHDYPGTSGCEATCEGDNVTAAQCASMFYCEWYQEKCWSRVGTAGCPATVAELNERTDDTLLESEGVDMGSCTVECEHETQSECAADPICTWTGGGAFPCTVNRARCEIRGHQLYWPFDRCHCRRSEARHCDSAEFVGKRNSARSREGCDVACMLSRVGSSSIDS